GDQRWTAVNGPIHIVLTGNRWDGPGLEVSTKNGPLSVSIPNGYGSAISMQTADRAPVSCKAPACTGAITTGGSPGTIRIGNGEPIVRLATSHGPVSIQPARD